MAKLSSRMHSSESKEIPRVVVCHFPHKFDSLPLKRGSSASVSPRYLTSEPHPPSIISTHRSSAPAVAACWRLWWRRKACGSPTASEREEEDEYEDYGSAQEEEHQGGYAQSDRHHEKKLKKRQHRDHNLSDTEESPTKAPKAARTSTHRSSTVSESSSLTDSHATASQSSRSSSQSAPRPRQSTTNGGKKGKKKHRRHPIEHRPNPPESPLDDSSHSRSDLRRIHRIQHRMVRKTRAAAKAALEAAAGESGSDSDSPSSPSSASRSSSSRSRRKPTPRGTIGGGPRSVGGQKSKDGSSRKRKGHQDDSDDDASQSGSEASQCEGFTMPSPKQIKNMTKKQLVDKLREQEKHSQQLMAASAAPPNKKVAAVDMTHWEGIPINFGDPNDEKCPMWRALFRTTRDKVYRIRKFINKESQVEPLCHLVMDHSDIPWLTLTGNKKVDVSKYPIVLITLPIDLCTLQISYHLPPFLYHQRSSSFASSSVLFGRIRPAACSTRCATMCRVRPSTR